VIVPVPVLPVVPFDGRDVSQTAVERVTLRRRVIGLGVSLAFTDSAMRPGAAAAPPMKTIVGGIAIPIAIPILVPIP